MAEGDPTRLHANAQDLTGRVFGKLTVLRAVGRRRGRVLWLCRCECGKEKEVSSANLLIGNRSKIRSCGCLRKPPLEDCLRRGVTNWGSGRVDVCWEWTGSTAPGGYGQTTSDGNPTRVHRLVYRSYVGRIPKGLWVLHRCDNPRCCNPAHLFLGTPLDNVRDMMAKGRDRRPRGEEHPHAKLTADQVREIRARHAAGGVTFAQLGREYGLHYVSVSAIVKGKKWKSVV